MFNRFKKWLAEPYGDDMSALDWFWFLGLIIVLAAIWQLILRHTFSD